MIAVGLSTFNFSLKSEKENYLNGGEKGGGLYIVREKRKKRGEVHAIMKRKLMKYCTSSTERERVRRLGGYNMIERGGGRESGVR